MNRVLTYIRKTYLSGALNFRVRLFNVLAMGGILVSLVSAVVSPFFGESPVNTAVYLAACALSAALLWYATKSGRYQLCYLITIVAIFMIGFPAFFFLNNAYYGAMPYFFVFAVLFTVFMLEGIKAAAVAVLELLVYIGVCVYAYRYVLPGEPHTDSRAVMLNCIFGFVVVGAALGLTMHLHFRMYNRQQRELEAAREEALRLSEVKNVFLANMSHEIRTPINVMLGMTEMVLRDSRDETVSAYARKIQNAGRMLLVLVSNILDLSRIESGKLEMFENRYRVAGLIQELFEIGSESARRHGLAFGVHVEEGLPAELLGDMSRIIQIVSNFLSNAAKYTRTGGVSLTFSRKAGGDDGMAVLKISVADTGIGIKKEHLSLLFDAFTRLDLPTRESIEGTGLGLAIAKQLTERMNGHIYVNSRYGEGSVFWVEIPQRIADARPLGDWKRKDREEEAPEESFTAPDARVLVVDDNPENLQTIQALLRRTLMRVDPADSGAACLEAAGKTDYHVILMDYMMPDMDGLETFRRLRETGIHAPVVALTANAVSGAEEKLLGAGFAAYIAKPVETRVLEKTLADGLALAGVAVTRRTIAPQNWVTPALKETLARDLAAGGVSLAEGLANASGDLPLLARMADVFVRNYPDSLASMRPFGEAAAPDLEGLRHPAHSLKSSASYVGASELSFLAGLVERGCIEGDSRIAGLALPLLYLAWQRAWQALKGFAAHVHAIEPKPPDQRDFQPERLAEAISRRVRRSALGELELLIARNGPEDPARLREAKRALEALDFDRAREILTQAGVITIEN